jgi:hypothetical protein
MSTLESSLVENSGSPNNMAKGITFVFRFKAMDISVFLGKTIIDGYYL